MPGVESMGSPSALLLKVDATSALSQTAKVVRVPQELPKISLNSAIIHPAGASVS